MALQREDVVRSALHVLDKVGLEALTLRKIADELGVKPPALYWHFKNKQDLLDEMATTVMRDAFGNAEAPSQDQSWREFLTDYAQGTRRMLLRHRDGAKMFSGTYLTDSSLYAAMETSLRALTNAGLALADAARALNTVYCYTIGFTIEEQSVEGDDRYGEARDRRIDPVAYPLALAAGREWLAGYDTRFEQ